MKLDPQQAEALFEAGGFVLISGLPRGTDVSIDNDADYTTQVFSGWKMIPPGLHLISYSPPSTSSSSNPTSGLSLRRGVLRFLRPKQTIVLRYSPEDEELFPSLTDESGVEIETVVGRDQLRTMDRSLAVYPFEQVDAWKGLSGHIREPDVERVLGKVRQVDGLIEVEGEEVVAPEAMRTPGLTSGSKINIRPDSSKLPECHEQEIMSSSSSADASSPISVVSPEILSSAQTPSDPGPVPLEPTLRFLPLDLKRSWRKGATGEEVTRFSRDKGWAFFDYVLRGGGDTRYLLAEFQLAFILFLRLYNFSSLTIHKNLLSLVSRSAASVLSPNFASTVTAFFPSELGGKIRKSMGQVEMVDFFTLFAEVLIGQVKALPEDAFSRDLEGIGLEEYWIKELDELYRGAASAVSSSYSSGGFSLIDFQPLQQALSELKGLGKAKFGWDLIDLEEYNRIMREQEEFEEETGYLEEGEDAPIVVEEE